MQLEELQPLNTEQPSSDSGSAESINNLPMSGSNANIINEGGDDAMVCDKIITSLSPT